MRSIARNTAIAAGCLVYSLLFAEGFIRVIAPAAMLPRHVAAAPYGVRYNAPNMRYWHRTAEYKIEIQTNSQGIRSPREFPFEKPEGVKRIVALGDSFAMGYEATYDEMFLTQLEKHLKAAGENVEIINLAVSGHGNAEELIALREAGLKYQPDLVLLAWNKMTDPNENVRSNLFALVDGKLERRAETYLPGVALREKLARVPLYNWLESNSHLYTIVREEAAANVKYFLSLLRGRVNEKRSKKNDAETEPALSYADELTVALIDAVRNESEAAGAQFILCDIPSQFFRKGYYPGMFIGELGEAMGLNAYTPADEFNKRLGIKLYWEKSHGHFTPLGNEIMGKGLADYILEHKLLEPLQTGPGEGLN